MSFYISKKINNMNFKETGVKLLEILEKENFGVVYGLNLKEKFKEKLNLDYSNYVIIGACVPEFAFKSLAIDPHVGIFFPCTIVVRELEDKSIEVFSVNPEFTMATTKIKDLEKISVIIRERLDSVLDQL